MGNTLAEVDQALHIAGEVLPLAFSVASVIPGVGPAIGAITPFLPLFTQVINAVDVVQQDTGKPIMDTIQDVLNHLTAGQPNAPALSPSAPKSDPSAPPALTTAGG